MKRQAARAVLASIVAGSNSFGACSEPFRTAETGGAGGVGGAAALGGTRAGGSAGALSAGMSGSGNADESQAGSAGSIDGGGSGGGAATGDAGAAGEGGQGGGSDAARAYPEAVLKDGPIAYWRMSITTGRVVPDETGGGNDLVLQGDGHALDVSGAIPGDSDGAMGFDGVAAFAIASDARALDFAQGAPFTLECWARRLVGGSEYFQHLFSNTEGTPGARNGYILYLLPEPAVDDYARSAFEYDALLAEVGISGPMPPASVWAHYVGVFDGSTMALYVDGTVASTQGVTVPMTSRSGPFAIGRASNEDARFFRGELDEVAVYGRALGPARVAAHYELGRRR